jgi:hypothetical protein
MEKPRCHSPDLEVGNVSVVAATTKKGSEEESRAMAMSSPSPGPSSVSGGNPHGEEGALLQIKEGA